jgi:membrane-bound serine protease (ClpP class)
VIVYVTPSGGNAASAGFYILESADIAAMSPGTNTGAAHPVGGGAAMDPVLKEKIENDLAAFMRSFTSKRGRNVEVAESAVRQSKSFTDQEALTQKLIDVVAKNENDLLDQLEGKNIKRFDGSEMTLHTRGKAVVLFGMTVKQRVLGFLMDPNIAFLILILGAAAIYAEFNHPGAVIPGVVGLICVVLAIVALNLMPVRFAAVGMLVAAFVLYILDVKFQTHGVLGLGGIVLMIFGALLLVDGPIPEMRIRLWTAIGVTIPFALLTIFLMNLAVKAHHRKVVTGTDGMIGEVGVAQAALAPEGKVFVHGELWNAFCPAGCAPGESIRVTGVDGLTLMVEPVRVVPVQRTPVQA